jgi:hypothetical protein
MDGLRSFAGTFDDIPVGFTLKRDAWEYPTQMIDQWHRLNYLRAQIPPYEWAFLKRSKEGRQYLRNLLYYNVVRGKSVVQEIPFSDEIMVLRKKAA